MHPLGWAALLGAGGILAARGSGRARGELGDAGPRVGSAPRVTEHAVRTIGERLAYIHSMARKGRRDGRIRMWTVQAVSRRCGSRWCVAEGDHEREVVAVFRALRRSMRYVHDTWGADLFQHPVRSLEARGGDCDDFTITLGASLGSIGYPVATVTIWQKGAPSWNHIYLAVGLPPTSRTPRWRPLDASTNRGPFWEPPASTIHRKRVDLIR